MKLSRAIDGITPTDVVNAVEVSNGRIRTAQAIDDRTWLLWIEPHGDARVGIRVPAGAFRDGDDRVPANTVTTEIEAKVVEIRVRDTEVEEAADATLVFAVTLSRALVSGLTVAYATSSESDDTATPGDDYVAKSGTLTFAPGETGKNINVSVVDDSVDEGNETMTMTLSKAEWANGSSATGTHGSDSTATT